MNYDWVLFDADHTLFDFDRSAEESLAETIRDHGIPHDEGHWELYNRINKEVWAAFENGEIDRETMRTRRFALFFEQIQAHSVDVESFAVQYLNGLPTRPYFIDGAIELIQGLHGHMRLGIITNGLKEVQRPRLTSTGFDRYFDIIVVSGEIGLMKPSAGFFEHAHLLMSRPDKSRVLVIGDSLNADIRGGAGFGFHTCWYNPGRLANDTEIRPDYMVHALEEIHALLTHG